jgi:uncharacterized protein YggL (DUF469 family)
MKKSFSRRLEKLIRLDEDQEKIISSLVMRVIS